MHAQRALLMALDGRSSTGVYDRPCYLDSCYSTGTVDERTRAHARSSRSVRVKTYTGTRTGNYSTVACCQRGATAAISESMVRASISPLNLPVARDNLGKRHFSILWRSFAIFESEVLVFTSPRLFVERSKFRNNRLTTEISKVLESIQL